MNGPPLDSDHPMDPFEAHVIFVGLLKKLDACDISQACSIQRTNTSFNRSQPSIQKVVGYALKYCARCGEDFWDCIVQECRTVCLNPRYGAQGHD
jgi:CTD kinase subunit gamma